MVAMVSLPTRTPTERTQSARKPQPRCTGTDPVIFMTDGNALRRLPLQLAAVAMVVAIPAVTLAVSMSTSIMVLCVRHSSQRRKEHQQKQGQH
jgi:hypothetical protein